ncbi:hypothetical protein Q8A73_001315 [Channa argus]|nr:hypothetical protein Q8A73_001315 [Channa argus]
MRKSGAAEKYVRVVQDMYESCKTVVRFAVGVTEEFKVEVGLHQGSALSPFLFSLLMDRLTDEVRQESPWTMMFADNIVICSESREQLEENLERWRSALENRGMKLSRSKTEYMCVNERDPGGTMRLKGVEVKKVQDFKYLGSTVQSNGECGKEVKRRVQAGWNGQVLSRLYSPVFFRARPDFPHWGSRTICQLDSLFFQESTMTRCTHEASPYQLLHGRPHIYDEVLGFKFRISPDAFFQVNQTAAEVLYRTVRHLCFPKAGEDRERTKVGGTLLDVCCGTGAIGITISPRVDKVIGVELIEQAVEDAKHNAALKSVLNCEFLPGKAEVVLPGLMSQLSLGGGSLTAVVNPARAGLHHRVVRALRNQSAIRRLVYVSCKPDGEAMRNFRELCFAPDQQKKITGEKFSPTLAVPVDMFPHTPHCELVILFER